MRRFTPKSRNAFSVAGRLVLVVMAAAALAGCETDGSGPGSPGAPAAQAAKPPEPPKPPMTRTRAAGECWMGTEKGSAGKDLDKRADAVTKCIDDKMKGAQAAPKS
jgi:hypothetical protein